jgi:DNA-directed RNA polymerase specialized sigma subunit
LSDDQTILEERLKQYCDEELQNLREIHDILEALWQVSKLDLEDEQKITDNLCNYAVENGITLEPIQLSKYIDSAAYAEPLVFLIDRLWIDPILARFQLHNTIPQQEFHIRKKIRDHLTPEHEKHLFLVVIKHSHRKKFMHLPLANVLFDIYENFLTFRGVDALKESGCLNEIPVEELRKSRIKKSFYADGDVKIQEYHYDLAPFYIFHQKKSIFPSNVMQSDITIEYFSEEDFNKIDDNWIDSLSCLYMQQALEPDLRDQPFAPKLSKVSTLSIIYRDQKKEFILSLSDKYLPLVKSKANFWELTKIRRKDKPDRDEELQEARMGLYDGAMAFDTDFTFFRGLFKPPSMAPWHLKTSVERAMGSAFDKLSSQANVKKRAEACNQEKPSEACNQEKPSEARAQEKAFSKALLFESFESSGGRLDDGFADSDHLSVEEIAISNDQEDAAKKAFREILNSLDSTDRKMLEYLLAGEQQNDIAKKLGISAPAINKRIKGIPNKIPPDLQSKIKDLF